MKITLRGCNGKKRDFDPKDDIESGESDSLTGYYYVEI